MNEIITNFLVLKLHIAQPELFAPKLQITRSLDPNHKIESIKLMIWSDWIIKGFLTKLWAAHCGDTKLIIEIVGKSQSQYRIQTISE